MTLKLNVSTVAKKPRTRKPAIAPNYTLAPAEPCPFVGVPVPAAVPVDVPVFIAGTVSEINGVEWSVSLFSDDTVRIRTSGVDLATGRFVATTRRTDYGYSVESQIVDVSPVDAVSADILRDLTSDLTFFAMRAGRFAGVRS